MGHRKLDRRQRTGENGQRQKTGTTNSDNKQRQQTGTTDSNNRQQTGDEGQGTTDIRIGT